MKKWDWSLITIMFVCVFFRLFELALRPPHFDEGIVGWWADQILGTGYYPYDPLNYHGPLPYYLVFLAKYFFGRTIWEVRFPSVLLGCGSVFIVTQFKDFVGKRTAYAAALLMAVSPAILFYTRYTPHEIGLLFFSLLTCYGYFRFVERRDVHSLWCLGLGFAGMATTKETFVIQVVCFGLACITLKIYNSILKIKTEPFQKVNQFTGHDIFVVTIWAALFFIILYSGFFLNGQGIIDFFRSFAQWFTTGTKGSGHDKPFFYWMKLFFGHEWAGLAGILLSMAILLPYIGSKFSSKRTYWMRLLAIYGLGTLLAYSIIPYKTPWCIIQLLWPFLVILSGLWSDFFQGKYKLIFGLALVVFVAASTAEAIRISFYHNSDHLEPYVYVQTYPEIMEVDAKLRALVEEDLNNYHFPIKIYMDDTWPLAWLWGEFTKISWLMGSVPVGDPDAPLVLVDIAKRGAVESHMKGNYYYKVFRLRDAQGESVVYYEEEKFRRFFGADAPLFKGAAK